MKKPEINPYKLTFLFLKLWYRLRIVERQYEDVKYYMIGKYGWDENMMYHFGCVTYYFEYKSDIFWKRQVNIALEQINKDWKV